MAKQPAVAKQKLSAALLLHDFIHVPPVLRYFRLVRIIL